MAQNPRDVEKARLVCEDLLDKKKYPCGNPIGGKWAAPASLEGGDMTTQEFWENNGELCIRKAHANDEFERTRQRLATQNSKLDKLRMKIVEQIQKDNQKFPGQGQRHYFEDAARGAWFARMFPAYYSSCVNEAGKRTEQMRACRYCKATGAEKLTPWQAIPHKAEDCKGKPPAWSWVTPQVNFSDAVDPKILAMKEGDFVKEPDFKLAKFRCNDHAAIIIQRLLDVNVETPFEILRMGKENKESQFHYFVVMGRDEGRATTPDGSIQPGELSPLEVLGKDAVIIDPWSTKHGGNFSRFPLEKHGINFELEKTNKWFVAPRSFPGLYPICRWAGTTSPDRAAQPYSFTGDQLSGN